MVWAVGTHVTIEPASVRRNRALAGRVADVSTPVENRSTWKGPVEYVPIDCSFHDRLESLAVHRTLVPIEVVEDGTATRLDARVIDVYSRDGAEYVKLTARDNSEHEFRLDHLVSVAGVPRPGGP